ncbi:MAG: TonB-dependent receptor, partial [Hyphomonadaceae bacterium]|nr:TonB-dependent receptor [Hyphomonadaceae bacterium]
MAKKTPAIASVTAALIAASVSSPAFSQAPDKTESFLPDEIIVTSSKREERLQDVAISLSAFDDDFLENAGVNSLTELQDYTPSLSIKTGTGSRATAIRIRGIGSPGSNSGIDPSVGVFIDGVYQSRAGMSLVDLVDVERVEVLRGPQGTLYGKNTAAGAISIFTHKPSMEQEGELALTYANDDRKEIRGMLNTPLGNSGHAMRTTAYLVNGDGLHTNSYTGEDVNNVNKWGAKTRVLLDLDSAGELLMTLDYSKEDTNCCALAVIDYDGLSPLNVPLTNTPSAALQAELGLNASGNPVLFYTAFEDSEGFSPPDADPFGDERWFDGEYYNKVDVGGVAAEWNLALPNKDALTFIGSWRNYKSDSAFDGDFTAYQLSNTTTDVELDQYSLELRVASPGGKAFDYVGGLYAYHSNFDSLGTFALEQPLVENIAITPTFPLSRLFPQGTVNIDTNQYQTTSYAAYGQLVWNIDSKFKPALGLRYTFEEKKRIGSQITTPTSLVDLAPIAGPDIFFDNQRSDSAISPSLNLRYFVNDDVMAYASASRGFKSGGFNQRRENIGSDGEFGEETATSFELGVKGPFFNSAVYYVDYDDFQTQTFDGANFKVTNAGSLESYGAEFEVMYP